MKMNCKYKNMCGGCNLDIDYAKSLSEKKDSLQKLFDDSNINCTVSDVVGLYYPYKYRNKIHLSFARVKNKTMIGFYEESTKRVIDIDICIMHDSWATTLIQIIREYVKSFKILPYDNYNHTGTIRYVVARHLNQNIQVTLVVSNQNFAGKTYLLKELQKHFKKVSLYININNRTDNAVFDKTFILKGGEKYLSGKISGVDFILSPNSFFQTNEKIAEKMYEKAIELLDVSDEDNIVDLYSGIGITSVMFAKMGANVSSIEYVMEAVQNAKNIAKHNNVSDKIKSYTGKCEDILPKLDIIHDDFKVFLDPARAGAEKIVLDTLISTKPKTIVYMSCNPETLTRDLKILLDSKIYKLTYVTPYDMFPHTKHLEVLAKLERM